MALSPSALESYLECPYKWFALRRLACRSRTPGSSLRDGQLLPQRAA
ncbi:MAG: PD-(D/E)XK nuclease family protein [Eggerthella lenta]